MSANNLLNTVGGSGVVVVPGDGGSTREFIITPISTDEYSLFFNHLVKMAEARQRESRMEFLADLANSKVPPAEKQAAIDSLVRSRDAVPTDDVINRCRFTATGTALELWYMAKPTSPGLKLDEIKAVVTDANYSGVRRQINEALFGAKSDDTKSGAGTPGPV